MIHGVSCRRPVYPQNFSVYYGFFLSFTPEHQYSIFRVVDVVYAVSYTAGFFLSIVDFPMCHCVYPCSSLSDPWC